MTREQNLCEYRAPNGTWFPPWSKGVSPEGVFPGTEPKSGREGSSRADRARNERALDGSDRPDILPYRGKGYDNAIVYDVK